MSIREPNVAMVMMRPICNILGWWVAKLAILQSPYQMYCITLMAIFDLLEVGYRIIALSSHIVIMSITITIIGVQRLPADNSSSS